MQDGQTRRLSGSQVKQSRFLTRYRACLVVIEGPASGTEYPLEAGSVTLGRGPDVDIPFQDDAMSKQHAAVELADEGYRVRDLGSTNGLLVNGSRVSGADLKHGDRLRLGEHTLQYVVERKSRIGVYDLSDQA